MSESIQRTLVVTLEDGISYPKGDGEYGENYVFRAAEASWSDDTVTFFGPNWENASAITVQRSNIRAIVYDDRDLEVDDE